MLHRRHRRPIVNCILRLCQHHNRHAPWRRRPSAYLITRAAAPLLHQVEISSSGELEPGDDGVRVGSDGDPFAPWPQVGCIIPCLRCRGFIGSKRKTDSMMKRRGSCPPPDMSTSQIPPAVLCGRAIIRMVWQDHPGMASDAGDAYVARLNAAETLRAFGNEAFAAGDYKRADGKYCKARALRLLSCWRRRAMPLLAARQHHPRRLDSCEFIISTTSSRPDYSAIRHCSMLRRR